MSVAAIVLRWIVAMPQTLGGTGEVLVERRIQRLSPRKDSEPIPSFRAMNAHREQEIENCQEAFRYSVGETPSHRLNALEKALDSEKPSKNAISVMLVSSSVKYFRAKS